MVRPQTAQKISSRANLAESAKAPLKLMMTPSRPLATAAAMPIREPPTAVAKNTAGKYGVKKTSGRICANPHRAAVASARQKSAKPTLKSSEGWEIPCQPCLNSSINFVIVVVTSRDQRIQNKADPGGIAGFLRDRARQARLAAGDPPGTGWLALWPAGGNIDFNDQRGMTAWDGWTARSR